ncbi:unnamed protein product [Gordionus sp. m RMFG-2023]|uniref:protein PF3D7_1417600-like isoform X2 n=1 Tax=Gordionus sp. m RMFG-2023 TaxID=3053472 RepID=UPI0030E23541
MNENRTNITINFNNNDLMNMKRIEVNNHMIPKLNSNYKPTTSPFTEQKSLSKTMTPRICDYTNICSLQQISPNPLTIVARVLSFPSNKSLQNNIIVNKMASITTKEDKNLTTYIALPKNLITNPLSLSLPAITLNSYQNNITHQEIFKKKTTFSKVTPILPKTIVSQKMTSSIHQMPISSTTMSAYNKNIHNANFLLRLNTDTNMVNAIKMPPNISHMKESIPVAKSLLQSKPYVSILPNIQHTRAEPVTSNVIYNNGSGVMTNNIDNPHAIISNIGLELNGRYYVIKTNPINSQTPIFLSPITSTNADSNIIKNSSTVILSNNVNTEAFRSNFSLNQSFDKEPIFYNSQGSNYIKLITNSSNILTSNATHLMMPHENSMSNLTSQSSVLLSPTALANISTLNDPTNALRGKKRCNCTKSQCLKLYCECFASGEFCSNCNCNNCNNTLENEDDRKKAIKSILERNPLAFHPKIGKSRDGDIERKHCKGCNCRRSGCLKNYCECYEAKITCSSMCKCVGCKNFEDSTERRSIMLPHYLINNKTHFHNSNIVGGSNYQMDQSYDNNLNSNTSNSYHTIGNNNSKWLYSNNRMTTSHRNLSLLNQDSYNKIISNSSDDLGKGFNLFSPMNKIKNDYKKNSLDNVIENDSKLNMTSLLLNEIATGLTYNNDVKNISLSDKNNADFKQLNSYPLFTNEYEKSTLFFPSRIITDEIIEAIGTCMLAQAHEALSESPSMKYHSLERVVTKEFGQCLLRIINVLKNAAICDNEQATYHNHETRSDIPSKRRKRLTHPLRPPKNRMKDDISSDHDSQRSYTLSPLSSQSIDT